MTNGALPPSSIKELITVSAATFDPRDEAEPRVRINYAQLETLLRHR
jgi:hypothetical protein